jgi:phosphoglycolate phosphatase
MTYILFDIDGTLTVGGEGGSAGSIALNRSFYDLFGVENAFDGIQKAGKTDPIITREGFEQHGVDFTPGHAERLREGYLHHLKELIEFPDRRPRVLAGAVEVLEALRPREDAVSGLLTGNWQAGAMLKLGSVGLDGYFDHVDGPDSDVLGAFGEDGATRPDLVPVALRRYRERTGNSIEASRTVILGDTPRDIECAQAHNVRSIGVATGPFSEEDLRAAEADVVLKDLIDVETVLHHLLS